MSQSKSPEPIYETHDRNDKPQTQAVQDPYNQQRRFSYLSSSSGSIPQSLRRTPRLEPQHRTRSRSASVDSATTRQQQQQSSIRFATDSAQSSVPPVRPSRSHTASATRADQRDVHPALHISSRTASAILYTLEVGLRSPKQFTIDFEEQDASMSDLFGASGPSGVRGTNGTGRTTATATGGPNAPLKTPRDIMREREAKQRAREERKQAEAAAEQERLHRPQDDEFRRNAPRTSEGISAHPQTTEGTSGPTRDSGYKSADPGVSAGGITPASQSYTTPTMQQQSANATARMAEVNRYAPSYPRQPYDRVDNAPSSRNTQQMQQQQQQQPPRQEALPTASSRPRHVTQPQDDPKLAPTSQPTAMTSASTTRVPQPPSQSQTGATAVAGPTPASQQVPQYNSAQPIISAPTGQATGRQTRNSNASSFPHAFERWETLSSRWEGLTSYWIRKLETNPQKADVNQEMARQITDLAAAGANLFHAVVELQRLRASSERKFQRWFFEVRAQQEEAQENQARLQRALEEERARRIEAENARSAMAPPEQNRNYERLLAEYQRELQISKDEARRAWEDLGRQEQMERERNMALREGNPIEIGGIQVVPHAAPARGGSLAQRPGTQQSATVAQGSAYQQSPRIHQEYDPQGSSPTNTDPFSSGERQAIIRPPAGNSRTYQQQQPTIPTRATSRPPEGAPIPPTAPHPPSTSVAPSRDAPLPTGASPSARFYTSHQGAAAPTNTSQAAATAGTGAVTGQYPTSTTPHQAFSGSETEEEPDWEVDSSGHVRLDASGNPIIARYPSNRARPHARQESDESDDYEQSRERRHARSAAQATGGQYAPAPGVVSGGQPAYVSGSGGHSQAQAAEVVAGSPQMGQYPPGRMDHPDYEGTGFGEDDDDWGELQSSRHHHPTRLSDVPEEDERSRGSLRSAGAAAQGGGVTGLF